MSVYLSDCLAVTLIKAALIAAFQVILKRRREGGLILRNLNINHYTHNQRKSIHFGGINADNSGKSNVHAGV